jgi:hypothetical protein
VLRGHGPGAGRGRAATSPGAVASGTTPRLHPPGAARARACRTVRLCTHTYVLTVLTCTAHATAAISSHSGISFSGLAWRLQQMAM